MKYLCLDIGDRRVGTAVGDDELKIATPVQVIERKSFEEDMSVLGRLVKDYSVEHIVVGLPRNMDNSVGAQATLTQTYAEKMASLLGLPLTFWDERLTTIQATEKIHAGGGKGKKSRKSLDAIAASVILQDFLDSPVIH